MVSAIFLAATLRMFGSAGAESQLSPANADSPLNPANVIGLPYTTNSADAALFADAKTERVKAHMKLRADASDRAADQLQLGEGFVQANLRPWLDVTAGRVIEKWGTGYAWNPVGFVSPQKNPTDPTDRRGAYRGVDMVRADAFVHDTNLSFYALREHAVAARAYRLVGGTDVSLYLRHDAGGGTQQGLSLARVFGDALELHGEATRRHVLLGGQYTFPASVNVVAELYRTGDGLTEGQWRAFRDSVGVSLLDANRRYAPLRMARNYAFTRADKPFGKNEVELITLTNLRDGSSIARVTLSRKLRPNLSAYVIETEFLGSGEMAYIQAKRLTTFGARVYF